MTNREERSTTQAKTIRVGEVREPTPRIEDHALIGDMRTAALVAKDGSIDWMCLPAFDSDACFAALLGTPANGYWKVAPAVPVTSVRRRYRTDTLILETDFVTETGKARRFHATTSRRASGVPVPPLH
jgi:GH15 family glucan-1,4-alpha-glucosidase